MLADLHTSISLGGRRICMANACSSLQVNIMASDLHVEGLQMCTPDGRGRIGEARARSLKLLDLLKKVSSGALMACTPAELKV